MMNEIEQYKSIEKCGYMPKFLIYLGLPKKKHERYYNANLNKLNIEISYTNDYIIPYTVIDRRIIEMIMTKAKFNENITISFKEYYEITKNNSKNSIDSYYDSLKKIINLTIITKKIENKETKMENLAGINLTLFNKYNINRYKESYFKITENLKEIIKDAPVHDQVKYLKMRSVYEQELYIYLLNKNYIMYKQKLNEYPLSIRTMYEQLGIEIEYKYFKRYITDAMLNLKTKYDIPIVFKVFDNIILIIRKNELLEGNSPNLFI